MLSLWVWVLFCGRFAGLRGVLETFVPFAIIAGIVCLLVLL
eukprot:COSAG04_NODE_4266_length_2198_cov_2.379705_3_plen_41_part_00